jgi:hypothetical protein
MFATLRRHDKRRIAIQEMLARNPLRVRQFDLDLHGRAHALDGVPVTDREGTRLLDARNVQKTLLLTGTQFILDGRQPLFHQAH